MIPLLSDRFRLIAMDYPGFGLSVHPEGYGYLPREHAAVVSELVEHLDLQDAILVGQDWGGPIGFDVASRDPERFSALVAGNTFFFVPRTAMQRVFSKVMGTNFMQKQLMNRNLFVKRFMPILLQTQMSDREFAHYLETAPTPESRIGHAVFPKAIVGETPWLAELEARVDANLSDRPLLRIMGMKDVPLTRPAVLAIWDEKFPNSVNIELPDAGHFWQEDAPEEAAQAIIDMYG